MCDVVNTTGDATPSRQARVGRPCKRLNFENNPTEHAKLVHKPIHIRAAVSTQNLHQFWPLGATFQGVVREQSH